MKYNKSSDVASEFINDSEIRDTIKFAAKHKNDQNMIDDILNRAKKYKGLCHRDAAVLLECEIKEKNDEIFALANQIKKSFYGNRIVIFAPLYLSNYCVNGCVYCPYHIENKHIKRKKLTQSQIEKEVIALEDMGHKRLALETGEDPINIPIEYVLDSIKTIYNIKHKNGSIRRVNVNIAATTVSNYKKLKNAEIGTYILFQETYNEKTYKKLHPTGPKHNYEYHTKALDRAMQAGIDDVGCGVLFGLYEYQYDFIGLLMHSEHLESVYKVGPHTISAPRIKKADGVDPNLFKSAIDDKTFAKIIACLRIAVPYTGIIISTRETQKCREMVLNLGVSQISGGSLTSVGGYSESEISDEDSSQFEISDNRSLDEIVNWLLKLNHIPSFCTACYKKGRTGSRFMSLSKGGKIKNLCKPNALITLKEYLNDYATPSTKKLGEHLLAEEISTIEDEKIKCKIKEYLKEIDNGNRNLRF